MQLIGVIKSAMIQGLSLQNQICILPFLQRWFIKISDPKGTGVLLIFPWHHLIHPRPPSHKLPILEGIPDWEWYESSMGSWGSHLWGIFWNFPSFDSLNTQFCKVYMHVTWGWEDKGPPIWRLFLPFSLWIYGFPKPKKHILYPGCLRRGERSGIPQRATPREVMGVFSHRGALRPGK